MKTLMKVWQTTAILLFVLMNSMNTLAQESVPIDEEHFPDEGFRWFVTLHATPDNISTITSWTISDEKSIYNIEDLRGIEYFSSLTSLNIFNCNIREADLSNNPNLKSLEMMRCPEITSFTISGHSEIESISISECEKIRAAHLSNNPKLETLFISGNNNLDEMDLEGDVAVKEIKFWQPKDAPLTTYDFSVLPNLEYLSFNNLYELDVSGCANLKHIDTTNAPNLVGIDVSKNENLEVLWLFGGSYLAQLDVSSNSKLTDLRINSHQMTSLDVSKNGDLDFLLVVNAPMASIDVSANEKLTTLILDTLQLTSIDISKNIHLKEFRCAKNKMKTLDLSKNQELSDLSCSGNLLTSLDLSNNPELANLNCSDNQLTGLDLQHNTKIKEVQCYLNQINEEAMTLLINSLPLQYGNFCVVYPDGDEGNTFTFEQYGILKSRRWTPYYMILTWYPYRGCYDYSKSEITAQYWGATGIETVRRPELIVHSDIYDLQGRKLPTVNSQLSTLPKGIYIRDGKKYVVK